MPSETIALPDDVAALIAAEFGTTSCAPHLLQQSRATAGYLRDTAFELLSSAKGVSDESWPERCLAVLLLEGQLLRLAPHEIGEFDVILTALCLKVEPGIHIPVKTSVLEEGFSTQDLRTFVAELVRRISRLNRVHDSIRHEDCGPAAWGYFLRAVHDVSKLTLARYVFNPDEVIQQIERRLIVTKGAEDRISNVGQRSAIHSNLKSLNAPHFEMEILRRLCADRKIYWVSERCGSELNALVEYPLTSAVVVIKPPGSDIEFEIKRAGTRGSRLLNVIAQRNGVDAPTSHRLFGGSLGWLAQRESAAAGIFSTIFQLVHGKDSPCSRGVTNSSVVTVPAEVGETHILDYLTEEQRFGPGFDATRAAMRECVESFPSDTGVARASYSGEAGSTLQFIGQALPQQAIIFGSSSFRLDRIALYLSEAGPEEYFRIGLGRDYNWHDARWLADTVLEEILGELTIPPDEYMDYPQYLRAAFHLSENRRRADENYLSVMRQVGECWGTLLAVRGFSDGESFVQRNVGLKSVWKSGAWQTRIIFMDHDDLTVAGSRYQYLWPWREVSGMQRDQVHILGGPMGDETIPGEVGALKNIYRVSPDVADRGMALLEELLREAYQLTQAQLRSNGELRSLFYPEFLDGYRDFDELVPGFLEADPSRIDSWRTDAEVYLKSKRYGSELIAEYIKSVVHFADFFERMRFLYRR